MDNWGFKLFYSMDNRTKYENNHLSTPDDYGKVTFYSNSADKLCFNISKNSIFLMREKVFIVCIRKWNDKVRTWNKSVQDMCLSRQSFHKGYCGREKQAWIWGGLWFGKLSWYQWKRYKEKVLRNKYIGDWLVIESRKYERAVQDESKTKNGISGLINRIREIRAAGFERMRHLEFRWWDNMGYVVTTLNKSKILRCEFGNYTHRE